MRQQVRDLVEHAARTYMSRRCRRRARRAPEAPKGSRSGVSADGRRSGGVPEDVCLHDRGTVQA